jgi:hypothetical protein
MIRDYEVRVLRGWLRGQKRGDIVTVAGEGNRNRLIRFGLAEAVSGSPDEPVEEKITPEPVKKKRPYRKKKPRGD